MDDFEFSEWIVDLVTKFPALGAWFTEMEVDRKDKMLGSWRVALRDVALADCLLVNQAMVAGDCDGPGEWPAEWQRLAALVRNYAYRFGENRLPEAPRTIAERLEHQRTLFVRDRIKAGLPRNEISRQLVAAGYENIAVLEAAQS